MRNLLVSAAETAASTHILPKSHHGSIRVTALSSSAEKISYEINKFKA
jgi:hypothetical protein